MNLTTRLIAAALVAAAATPVFAHDAALPGSDTLPKDIVGISGVVPAMGEHWANPSTLPLGPIYGVHDGKLIFFEYMIAQEDFESGKSFVSLAAHPAGVELPAVDHTDIEFQPKGHEGFEVPHYDIHMYFISHDEHMAIMP